MTAPGARPPLVLHIGLPKTATTFLQHSVFGVAPGITFLHRKRGPREAAICHGFRDFARFNAVLALRERYRLRARLRSLIDGAPNGDAPRCLLVSEENISVLASGFWIGQGSDPTRLAHRLAAFARSSAQVIAPLRVIIGIRRQDQWLASRYAESSKHFTTFCQADFDRRMAAIAGDQRLRGPLGWLDYDAVERTFAAALGGDNVLLAPLERVSADAPLLFGELAHFLGGETLRPAPFRSKAEARAGRNRLSRGENLWKMRAGGQLTLSPPVQAAILDRFAASNAALGARQYLGFDT